MDHYTPTGIQVVFIPATSNENHLVPTIIEEHKLYFNPHIISLMFMWDPEDHITWDVHQSDQPNACDVYQGVHDALEVPIIIIDKAHINSCITCWMCEQKYKP